MNNLPIITLDGPAGVGKSTLARRVASILKLPYLDTGAMFRTVALRLGNGAEKLPAPDLLARCMGFRFQLEGVGENTVLLCNDIPIGREIRTEYVGELASRLATVGTVREYLKGAQQHLGKKTALVVEGRDMGTVIFPGARFKFFLDATPEVRGMRRFLELKARGEDAELSGITEMIRRRDYMDRNRTVAPLRPARDAIVIDTSDLDIDGVLRAILEIASTPSQAIEDAIRDPENSSLHLADCPQKEQKSAKLPDDSGETGEPAQDAERMTMPDDNNSKFSARQSIAQAVVSLSEETLSRIRARSLPRGDALATAQAAGILAAKRTAELIPLCHHKAISFAEIRFKTKNCPPSITIEAEIRSTNATGTETEALVAVQTAAATLYDMCKSIQRDIVIREARLVYTDQK